jgi:hypothetical protein
MRINASRPAPLVGGISQAGKAEGFGSTFGSQDSQPKDQHPAKSAAARGRLKTQYVQARGSSAEYICSAMQAMLAAALVIDGPRAVECPKSSAAFHEAGHCLIDALNGTLPASASIWPIREIGRLQWIGRTIGTSKWCVNDGTPAEADLKQARSQLAGVVAEALFDPDYRIGSSLDEIVISQSIARTAAIKLVSGVEELWLDTLVEVASKLKAHEWKVREIANELMKKGSIKARRLRALLKTVGGVDE